MTKSSLLVLLVAAIMIARGESGLYSRHVFTLGTCERLIETATCNLEPLMRTTGATHCHAQNERRQVCLLVDEGAHTRAVCPMLDVYGVMTGDKSFYYIDPMDLIREGHIGDNRQLWIKFYRSSNGQETAFYELDERRGDCLVLRDTTFENSALWSLHALYAQTEIPEVALMRTVNRH